MVDSQAQPAVFRFDGVVVDTVRREVRRNSQIVPLAPKPFELLLLLLFNRHRSVSRAEIHSYVWHDVRVSEATLASTLRDLRRALGDTGQGSRLIRTIRGVGMRFVAPVEQELAAPRRIFVGRRALLARLHAALAAAALGQGGIELISGEAGVGKTRLAEEFAVEAAEAGARVCFGRCPEAGQTPPYRPWVQILRALAESRSAEELAADLGPGAADLADLLPEHAPPGAPLSFEPAVATEAALFRLFDAVAGFLRRAARRAPLVLVLDDLHRADRPSLRLLEFVAADLSGARVLLLGLYRSSEIVADDPLVATLAELSRNLRFDSQRLSGLAPDETRMLVEASAPTAPPPEVVAAILERSEGNPFFASALTRQWVDSPGDWARGVPPTVLELVRGRLLRLSKQCREVLGAAALIGRDLELDLLARACELEEDAVADALDEARRAGLVEHASPRFAHALVREAIYAELPGPRRRELHQRVAEVLDAQEGPARSERLAEIARHFASGTGSAERALDSAVRAAEEAERNLAFAEGPSLYELAIETLERVRPLDRMRRCDLLLALARSCLRDHELEPARRAAEAAALLARELRSPGRLAQAALALSEHIGLDTDVVPILEEALAGLATEPTPLRALVLSELSRHLVFKEQDERQRQLADEAVLTAREAGNASALVSSLVAKRYAYGTPGRISERLAILSEAIGCARRAGLAGWEIQAASWRAADLFQAGDVEGAEQDVARVEEIARQERLVRFEGFPSRWRAMRAIFEGRYADGRTASQEALAIGRRARDPNAVPRYGAQLIALLYEEGRGDELAKLVEHSTDWATPVMLRIPAVRVFTAVLDVERGDRESARRVLDEMAEGGFAAQAESSEFLMTASFLAELCSEFGDAAAAAMLYERLAPFADQVAIFEHALTCRGSVAHALGQLARVAGRLDEAERQLGKALAVHSALGAAPALERTRRELAEVERLRGSS